MAGASALALLAGMLATPALAQDGDPLVVVDPRGTITVSATRVPQKIDEVPATVSVITDRQIADQLASDIKDLVDRARRQCRVQHPRAGGQSRADPG